MKHWLLFTLLLFATCLSAQVVVRPLGNHVILGKDYLWGYNLDWHDAPPVYFYRFHFEETDSSAGIFFLGSRFHQILVDSAYPHRVRLLSVGDTVGPNSGFWGDTIHEEPLGALAYQGPDYPDFNTAPFDCKYVGMRFHLTPDSISYAWLSIQSDSIAPYKIRLKRYAFQATNKTPIVIDELCTVTGDENKETSLSWTPIHPNPAQDRLWIDLANQKGKVRVEMADAMGRLVQSHEVVGGKHIQLALNSLDAGVYYLRILNGAGCSVRRIVKL